MIREHLNGASKYSLVKKYNLSQIKCISDWMLKFGIDEKSKRKPNYFMSSPEKKVESEELCELRMENKRLKLELEEARLAATAYDTMIDVAEEMFHIPIRKKPGTKQS